MAQIKDLIKGSWIYNRLKTFYFTSLLPKDRIPRVTSYHLDWYPAWADLDGKLQALLARPGIQFIQIGANDGITGDPLYPFIKRFGWKGILIEPMLYNFKRLQETHKGNPDLVLLHAAVSDHKGIQTFYSMRDMEFEGKPLWYDQIGSFNKEVILWHKQFYADVEKNIVETEVPVVAISDLYKDHHLRHVDLIHIDTEGYDYEILRTLDLDHDKPDCILFEYCHLNIRDYQKAMQKLKKYGYQFCRGNQDTLAYLVKN